MRKMFIGVFALVLGIGTSAFAQRTTGSIVGTVADESGAFLPGVTITVSGPAIAGMQTAVSGPQGAYRFPALPPGIYSVKFELGGFATLERTALPVSLGSALDINVQLKISTLSETITVTGEPPVVDTATAEVSTHFNREWVENAPQRRKSFFDLINQATGVSAATSTNPFSQAYGGSTSDNSYQLDGTDFTAPVTGAAWPWPNTDAIEEVEVLGLGASAEYGNVQGAVFNIVTRQGSNKFAVDGNFYWQNQGITGRNTTDAQDNKQPYYRDQFVDTTWQVGGPIKQDKLWFFGSFQYQIDSESQPGTPKEFPARSSAKRMFLKANYQIDQANKLQFAYHDDFYRIPGRATALTAPSTIGVENGHNPSPNLTWTTVISDKAFFEARVSGFYGTDHGDPLESTEPRVKPRFNDLDTGQITGGIYSWYDGASWKTAASGKYSYFADHFMGASQDITLGVQYDEGGSDYVLGPNDYIYTYGSTPQYGYTQLPWHQGGQKRGYGLYFDDTARVGSRVTLNLGLRYDYSKGSIRSYPVLDKNGNETSASSPVQPDIFSWSVFSPRLGAVIKLDQAGKTLVKGHYGRYYRGIITGEFDSTTPSVTPRFIFDGIYTPGGQPIGAEKVSDNTNLRVDPNFANPYTDQFIVGFERELFKDFGMQVNYVYKNGNDYGGWHDVAGSYVPRPYVDSVGKEASGSTFILQRLVTPATGRLFELTTLDGLFTKYKGLAIQGTKRMSNHWQMNASVVLSKSTGRLGSSLASPSGNQTGTAGTFNQNPNDFVNTDGRLIGDRPTIGKLQFMYELPKGFTLGLNYAHLTGRLWSRQIRVGGLGFPSSPTINMEANTGDRRVPNLDTIDVRLDKEFKFGGTARASVLADFLNLTNSDSSEGIGSRLGTSSSFALPTRYIHPRRMMLGAKIKF